MNNEIKFRGFSTQKGQWIYGDLMQTEPNPTIIENCDATDPANFNWVESDSVGLFSMIKDIKDVEVYSGDIIKCPKGRNDVIEMKNGAFWLRYRNVTLHKFLFELGAKVEVIGNILKTPELAEV